MTKRLCPDPDLGDEIAVDVFPGRTPTLTFLHGMTSTRLGSRSEALLARAQARGLGFARFDFRGHGDSDGILGSLRFSQLVEDTRTVVAEVGPCVLVGSSMGALAAAWTAARHPAGIVALVLMSPALGYLGEMSKHRGPFELQRDDEPPVRLHADALRDAEQFDEATLPDQLRLPVLLVHGSDDATVPVELSLALCAAIPHQHKDIWVVEGGSHSLHEVTDPVFDRMETFLCQHGLITCVG